MLDTRQNFQHISIELSNKANSWIARDKWKKLLHLDQIKDPLISKLKELKKNGLNLS